MPAKHDPAYEQLVAFLVDLTGSEVPRNEPDSPLISSGLLDSMAAIEVLLFLEPLVGRELSPTEIMREQFDSVNMIYAFLQANRQPAGT